MNETAGGNVHGLYNDFICSVRQDWENAHREDMEKVDKVVYQHRLNIKGEWIEYTGLLYQKIGLEDLMTNGVKLVSV